MKNDTETIKMLLAGDQAGLTKRANAMQRILGAKMGTRCPECGHEDRTGETVIADDVQGCCEECGAHWEHEDFDEEPI